MNGGFEPLRLTLANRPALQPLDPTGIPSADNITVTVTQGGTSTAGTVWMLYDRHSGHRA